MSLKAPEEAVSSRAFFLDNTHSGEFVRLIQPRVPLDLVNPSALAVSLPPS
jgi:hypothetical protein